MTIQELAEVYADSAQLLNQRIKELEREGAPARRLTPLRAMKRECRQIARYLRDYYKGGTPWKR